jgi:hypothetical protein
MQLPNDIFVTFEPRMANKQLGQFALRIAIRRQRTGHTGDDAHQSHLSVTKLKAEEFNPIV